MFKWINKYFNKESVEYKRRKYQQLSEKLEKVKEERRKVAKELEND